MIQTTLAYTIVTFALIGLLSNFFFIFFEEVNNELNKDEKKKGKSKQDQDHRADMYALDTWKMVKKGLLPKKFKKNYPSHLADMEV